MTRGTLYDSLRRITGASLIAAMTVLSANALQAEDGHDHAAEGHSGEAEGGHTDEVKISPEAMKIFGISLDKAVRRTLTETTVAPARASYNAEAMAHVGSPVEGRAGELKVRLGDVVRKGDVLAVIESPDLGSAESELLQKRSLREAAESAVEVANLAFQRAEELRKTNSVSVTDFLSRQGDLKKAEGELKVASAEYLAAENHLHILGITQVQIERLLASGEVTSLFELKAPIAGTVVQREVTPGEVVGPDRETLMVIADMSTLWVLADVPERMAHRVISGSKGRMTLGAAEGAVLEGTVSYISPELNPRTRTAQIRLVIDAAGAVSFSDAASSASPPEHDDHAGHGHEGEAGSGGQPGHGHDAQAGHAQEDGHDHEHEEPGLTTPAAAAAPSPLLAGQLLRPGLFVQVELELNSVAGVAAEPVLAVPEDAVQTVEGREAVFVPADEPNTFTPAPLTLGRRVGHYYPVISGLKDGDSYVAKGSFLLKAEMGKEGAAHEH